MITYRRISSPDKIKDVCDTIASMKLYEVSGDFQNWVRMPTMLSSIVAAFDDKELVGYSLTRPYSVDWRYNSGVFVSKDYRRRGIGTEIMSRMQNVEDKLVVDIYGSDIKRSFFGNVEKVNGKSFHYKF